MCGTVFILFWMVRNRMLQVRATKEQYERIRVLSRERGFATISDYVRYVCLSHDFALFDKVHEIHAALVQMRGEKRMVDDDVGTRVLT